MTIHQHMAENKSGMKEKLKKHHLGFIRTFAETSGKNDNTLSDNEVIKTLKHIGNSVMDVYKGKTDVSGICMEICRFLLTTGNIKRDFFEAWVGGKMKDHRVLTLSDGSEWMVKYFNSPSRYVHIFPSRGSRHSFRVKSNALKTALIYYIKTGKDYVTRDDLNKVRPLLGLSPVSNTEETKAIIEMIEILRNPN